MENQQKAAEKAMTKVKEYTDEDIKRIWELNDKERLQADKQKAIFKERLLNADDVANAVRLLIKCYDQYAGIIIDNQTANAKTWLDNKHAKHDPTSAEYLEKQEQTHKEYWQKVCEENKEYFKGILDTGTIAKELKTQKYKKMVDYVTKNIETNHDARQKQKAIIESLHSRYGELLNKIDPALIIFIQLYLDETGENNRYVAQTSIITMLARELTRAPEKIEIKMFFADRGYKDPKGKNFIYAYAMAEIIGNFTVICKSTDRITQPNETADTEEKRTYTKELLKRQGGAFVLNYYDNNLMHTRTPFKEEPTEITERKEKVKVSITPGAVFQLSRKDIRLDTIIGNIAETNEFETEKYKDVTLLNVANYFYNEKGKTHYTSKQLEEILNLIARNMQPLIFEFENGDRIYTSLISVEIRKKRQNATPTIRINKNQFISEYNKRVKGERIKVYVRNLKDLGLKNTLRDSELAETIRELLTKRVKQIRFEDFQDYYNADSPTEKARFKKKVKGIIKGYAEICQVERTEEIKKYPRQKTSETTAIKVTYAKNK